MKSKLFIALALVCLLSLVLNPATGAAAPQQPAAWSVPEVIYQETWPHVLKYNLNDTGDRLVGLVPYSGSNAYTRDIVATEKVGGTWQTPVIIAQNGLYSDDPVQILPQVSHPVLSRDGSTIAYVGWNGTTNAAFVIDRQPDGSWGAPVQVNNFPNTHYWISLSQDGNALALCDYPYLDVQKLYVMTRTAGVWGAPVLIGEGGDPNISADGTQVVFIYNANLAYSHKVNGSWSAPQPLTSYNWSEYVVEFPQISGDGQSLYYWLVTLVLDGSAYVRTEQNLYVMRRAGAAWGAPQKVNSQPVVPARVGEGPAAANASATRFIYSFPLVFTDPNGDQWIDSAHLKLSELSLDSWQESILVEKNGFGNYNRWPKLTPDGKTLVYDAGIRYLDGGGAVYNALWQMTTTDDPPLPPVSTALITSAGGTLTSAIDGITYTFPPGAFSEDVLVTHTSQPQPAGPPPGNQGALGMGFSVTASTAATGLPAQPAVPIPVTITYDPANSGTAIPGTLCLWWMDVNGWVNLGGNDDGLGALDAQISHFSDYAVFGSTHQVFLPSILH